MTRSFTPRPYQLLMEQHALELPRSARWAGMGMGKTTATLAAICAQHMLGDDAPVLILGPLRVIQSTWPDECKKWDEFRHLDVVPICGSKEERLAALRVKAPIYACNYDNLPWLVEHWGDRWPYQTVVSDESTRLKGFRLRQGGVRTQALGKVAHTRVRRFWELTGTPSPNGLQDLWGQIWFLDGGERLGRTHDAFKQRWFRASQTGYGLAPADFAQAQIQDRLRDIVFTVEAKDWFDLREPITRTVEVDLPPRARALYREMERRMFMELDGHEVEAFNAAARTNKCLQLANGAAYVDDAGTWKEVHDAKLQALESIIEEAAGMPVLVAYNFKSDLARLSEAFPKGRQLDARPGTVRDWNAGKIPVLFAHPASAGHGLNLQDGGNILVYFGHSWNLEERLQIAERIGPTRQMQAGHDRPVFVYNIVARDTVDELVLERVESKREVQDILMDAMKRRQ